MEPFVLGQPVTPEASSGEGGAAGELDFKTTYAALLLERPPVRERTTDIALSGASA